MCKAKFMAHDILALVNYCIEILKTTDNKTVLFQLLYQLLKILSRYFFIHDISCLANFSAMWL